MPPQQQSGGRYAHAKALSDGLTFRIALELHTASCKRSLRVEVHPFLVDELLKGVFVPMNATKIRSTETPIRATSHTSDINKPLHRFSPIFPRIIRPLIGLLCTHSEPRQFGRQTWTLLGGGLSRDTTFASSGTHCPNSFWVPPPAQPTDLTSSANFVLCSLFPVPFSHLVMSCDDGVTRPQTQRLRHSQPYIRAVGVSVSSGFLVLAHNVLDDVALGY